MIKKILLILIYILVNFLSLAKAQITSDSLSTHSIDSLKNKFVNTHTRLLNTSTFLSILDYRYNTDLFSFSLKDRFSSTIVKSIQNNIKDENTLGLSGSYKINNNFSFGTDISSKFYNDNRNQSINSSSINQFNLFTEISFEELVKLKPFLGYSFNKQMNIMDKGLMYGSNILFQNFQFDDFMINSDFSFSNEDIENRKNISRLANLSFITKQSFFDNTILFNYNQNSLNFYNILAESTENITTYIQNRNEKAINIANELNFYPEINGLQLNLTGQLSIREINRNANLFNDKLPAFNYSNLNELKINLQTSIKYDTKKNNFTFVGYYSDKEEKHNLSNISDETSTYYIINNELEKQKNNNLQVVTLTISNNTNITENDKLIINLLHRKLKYDTPSISNYDDRDDLLSIARFGYIRKINPFFNFLINIEGSFNHLVYINAKLSSNNNKRRFLKLNTGGDYKGSILTSKNLFEVSSNYTSYDFEDSTSAYQSYSFRQFLAKDSTAIKLSKTISLVSKSYLKLSEQGNFSWSNFSTNPSRYIEEIYFEPSFVYEKNDFIFGSGFRYFCLNTFNYKNSKKILTSEYISIGIFSNIFYKFRNNFVKFYYLYEIINYKKKNENKTLNLNLEITITL